MDKKYQAVNISKVTISNGKHIDCKTR